MKVQKAPFKKVFVSKAKIKPLIYGAFQIQEYLTSNQLNREEI